MGLERSLGEKKRARLTFEISLRVKRLVVAILSSIKSSHKSLESEVRGRRERGGEIGSRIFTSRLIGFSEEIELKVHSSRQSLSVDQS